MKLRKCEHCSKIFNPHDRQTRKQRTCSRACTNAARTKSLVGQRFGKLLVIADGPYFPSKKWRYSGSKVKCDCGNEKFVRNSNLKRGLTRSCGCVTRKHGFFAANCKIGVPKAGSTYHSWRNMMRRCYDPRNPSYLNYGGRGIRVCDQWRNDFKRFVNDVGDRPIGKTLDRIDNDKNYQPGNVRWATAKEQARHRRNNRVVVVEGIAAPVTQHCERYGIGSTKAYLRLDAGWTPDNAFLVPDQSRSKTARKKYGRPELTT